MKASKWIFLALIILIVGLRLQYKVAPETLDTSNDEAKAESDRLYQLALDEIGTTRDDVKGPIDPDKADEAIYKEVIQYRTLADAEKDMGYYLGFHNTIKSVPQYELVRMLNVGDGAWYQANYESDDPYERPYITVKTTNKYTVDTLTAPYTMEMKDHMIKDYFSTTVYMDGNDGNYNLISFSVPNNKSYALYIVEGMPEEFWDPIITELITNLMSMDDWIDY